MSHPIRMIAAFTVLEAVRNRLLWLVLVVLVVAFGLAEFIGEMAITESIEVKSGVLGGFLRLFAVFVVSLFVATSMVRELNDKGFELILSLPISRASYYFGKLVGFSLVALAIAALVSLLLLLYVPPLEVMVWGLSLACELLIIAALSLVCLFSFNQVTVALSAVAGFYLLARTIDAIQLMGQGPLVDLTSLSQKLISAVLHTIAFVLPELHRFTPSEWLIYHTATWSDLLPVLGQSAVYIVLLIGAGLFDLYRKSL